MVPPDPDSCSFSSAWRTVVMAHSESRRLPARRREESQGNATGGCSEESMRPEATSDGFSRLPAFDVNQERRERSPGLASEKLASQGGHASSMADSQGGRPAESRDVSLWIREVPSDDIHPAGVWSTALSG
jgi:hypothetical protein